MSEATKKTAPTLSQRETEILIAALTNVKSGDIQIDYANMAVTLNVASIPSATARWSEVRKKLGIPTKKSTGAANGEPSAPKARTPRKPASTKKAQKTPARVKDEVVGEEDADELAPPPTTPQADNNNEEVDVPATPKTPETPAATKKRGRKTKAEKEAEAAANGGDADVEDKDEKPAKKPRKTPVKKKAAAATATAAADADGEAEVTATPPKAKKATPRKTAAARKKPAAAEAAVADAEEADDADAPASDDKVKNEKLATDATMANDVLNGNKAVTPDPEVDGEKVDDTSSQVEEEEDGGDDDVVVEDAGITQDTSETISVVHSDA